MQKLSLIGHIGQDARLNTLSNGDTVINFSVAVSKRYKNKTTQEVSSSTTWFSCSIWRKEALAPFLLKGTQVYLEGEVSAEIFALQNGTHNAQLKVNVQEIQLLGGRSQSEQGASSGNHQHSPQAQASAAPAYTAVPAKVVPNQAGFYKQPTTASDDLPF